MSIYTWFYEKPNIYIYARADGNIWYDIILSKQYIFKKMNQVKLSSNYRTSSFYGGFLKAVYNFVRLSHLHSYVKFIR